MRTWLNTHGNQIVVGLIVAALAGLGGLIVRAILEDEPETFISATTTTVVIPVDTGEPSAPETNTTVSDPATTTGPTDATTPPSTATTTSTAATSTTSTTSTTTTTTTPPTFLEQLVGDWTLIDWRERPPDPVTLGMDAINGTLKIDEIGNSVWELDIDDGGPPPEFTPGVRCLGVVDQTDRLLTGVSGRLVVDGEDLIGDQRDWTRNLTSLRADAAVAFCGWTFEPESNLFVYDTTFSAYDLDVSALADAERTPMLTMSNAAGTFTWRKDS